MHFLPGLMHLMYGCTFCLPQPPGVAEIRMRREKNTAPHLGGPHPTARLTDQSRGQGTHPRVWQPEVIQKGGISLLPQLPGNPGFLTPSVQGLILGQEGMRRTFWVWGGPTAEFAMPKEREFPDSKNSGQCERKETIRGAISRSPPEGIKKGT